MKKRSLFILLALICMLAVLIPMTASAAVEDGWQEIDGNWYYGRDGQWVTEEVIRIGSVYYGFDGEGVMYDNEEFVCNGSYYRAKSGGALYCNTWYQDTLGYRYRYGADAAALEDFHLVDGKWYFFYGDGSTAQDGVVWSGTYMSYYALNREGTDSKALKLGWTQAFGNWYYLYEDWEMGIKPAYEEVLEINGVRYYFNSYNRMAANQVVWDYEHDQAYLATASGALLENGWAQVDGKWYYAEDYVLFEHGFKTIGGNTYYFDYYTMYDIPGELVFSYAGDSCYVEPGGALSRNKWYKDKTGDPYYTGWVYFGDDCFRVLGLQTIGGVTYHFDEYGIMQTNSVGTFDEGVYVFDKDGKGTKVNGWFKHPKHGYWMYAQDGNLAEGILTIQGETYAFYGSGEMVTDSYYYYYDQESETAKYYLFGQDGKVITAPGWKKLNGEWYYVADKTGLLKDGWLQSGGKWYYFCPEMAHNTVFFNEGDGKYYAADGQGVTTALTGNGWKNLDWGRTYLENGKPVQNAWRKIGGSWYYFQMDGTVMYSDIFEIDGQDYVFDNDGKMVVNNWYRIYGNAYYADANGHPVKGLQTIGGKQYLFDSYGSLRDSGVYGVDGKTYWVDDEGVVIAQVKEGWNQIGGKWYYLRDGEMLRNALLWLNGVGYGFGSDYAMCTDGVRYAWFDYYMFDKDGKILTGWQKFDGKWYYAHPDTDDPCIVYNGIIEINGKEYAFKDGYMQTGSMWINNTYVTTDSNGVVIKYVYMQEGWNYVDGNYIYIKDGDWYTGWVGDYYIEGGYMQFAHSVEYAGNLYWLGADGRYVKNSWIKDSYTWQYAKADGTLYTNEWALIGGKYYYFNSAYAVRNEVIEIDGKYHEFDKNGVWLGEWKYDENTVPEKSDGWHKIGGKWYYYYANNLQTGVRYIDGKWYALHYEDGAMVTNAVFENYYYGADGTRANYTGWKQIDGKWCYFGEDHRIQHGWIRSGSGWYYTDWHFNEKTWEEYPVMLANQAIVYKGKLYHFDASGYCSGPVTKNGWYQAGEEWYYVQNGNAITDDYCVIDGAGYYFAYDGAMVTNASVWVNTVAGSHLYYFGANGKAVTKPGWMQTTDGWIYITAEGYLCDYGIYKIGGQDYTFVEGIWVK